MSNAPQVNSIINLKSLLVPSKSTEVDFPGFDGFKINVSFLSREELVKMRKKATKVVYKNRLAVEELNDELFLQLYVTASIKGWTGLKLAYVAQLCPVDLTGQNLEDTLEFSDANALSLMQSSSNFDAFISEAVTDLGNFQASNGTK
jgi:hypothetical protein